MKVKPTHTFSPPQQKHPPGILRLPKRVLLFLNLVDKNQTKKRKAFDDYSSERPKSRLP